MPFDVKVALLTYKVCCSSTSDYFNLLSDCIIKLICNITLVIKSMYYMCREHELYVALEYLVLLHRQYETNCLLIFNFQTCSLFWIVSLNFFISNFLQFQDQTLSKTLWHYINHNVHYYHITSLLYHCWQIICYLIVDNASRLHCGWSQSEGSNIWPSPK